MLVFQNSLVLISTMTRYIFSTCLMWVYTQINSTITIINFFSLKVRDKLITPAGQFPKAYNTFHPLEMLMSININIPYIRNNFKLVQLHCIYHLYLFAYVLVMVFTMIVIGNSETKQTMVHSNTDHVTSSNLILKS